MRVKDAVGRFGEDVAVRYLEADGYTVLARNWRCRRGELDIVARDGADLVFVEVKTRSGVGFGVPAAAIDHRKATRIRQLAAAWLAAARDGESGAATDPVGGFAAIRFDVIAVLRPRGGGRVTVDHLRGAF